MGSNSKLKEPILQTLQYYDQFEYPLTTQEIRRFLGQIRNPKLKIRNKFKIQITQVQNHLNYLIKATKISKKGDFYCLKERERIIKKRLARKKVSQKKIKIVKKLIFFFKLIPWVKMVGITGNLSMDNAKEEDDIDLMVITQVNRLWMVRLLILGFLEILGKRRKARETKVKDKICLNLLLDETSLNLSKEKQNQFIAHEICQMKPILNKDYTYEKFLKANLWVKKWLPNGVERIENLKLKIKYPHYSLLITYLLDLLEKVAFQFQLRYMKAKRTTEEISPHFAFFHPKKKVEVGC